MVVVVSRLKNLHSKISNSPCKIKSDVEFDGLIIV
jgi:hypothetical protein